MPVLLDLPVLLALPVRLARRDPKATVPARPQWRGGRPRPQRRGRQQPPMSSTLRSSYSSSSILGPSGERGTPSTAAPLAETSSRSTKRLALASDELEQRRRSGRVVFRSSIAYCAGVEVTPRDPKPLARLPVLAASGVLALAIETAARKRLVPPLEMRAVVR